MGEHEMFFDFKNGLEVSALATMYPSRLLCCGKGRTSFSDSTRHAYGFVLQGQASITRPDGSTHPVYESMTLSVPGAFELQTTGKVVVIERYGYRGLFQVGGPVENDGRLTYIDGCRTTILAAPSRLGDPVLNYLVFPANVKQTMHLHPTVRLGTVISGEGLCVTPKEKIPIKKGMVFYLPENSSHCFHSSTKGLKVIAFHPDSDTGPTDFNHPMLNRTFLRK